MTAAVERRRPARPTACRGVVRTGGGAPPGLDRLARDRSGAVGTAFTRSVPAEMPGVDRTGRPTMRSHGPLPGEVPVDAPGPEPGERSTRTPWAGGAGGWRRGSFLAGRAAGLRGLDGGWGTGALSEAILPAAATGAVVGVDPSAAFVQHAAESVSP